MSALIPMSEPIRARVWRRPDADVTGLGDLEPVTIPRGWGWYLHRDGAQLVGRPVRTAGTCATQQDALNAACSAIKSFVRECR